MDSFLPNGGEALLSLTVLTSNLYSLRSDDIDGFDSLIWWKACFKGRSCTTLGKGGCKR
jgi:hypothetical protein